ncbi:MAG: hypothetical protein IPJ07_10480 [Acidobacteria bacterium]|nr:hypothetical protein [Acidobacteriota bacterium]
MNLRSRIFHIAIMTLCVLAAGTMTSMAQQMPQRQFDPLSQLKRAINQAGAPELSAQQEIELTTLIKSYRDSLPSEPDDAIEAARDAFNSAILAGDLATAQAQATVLSTLLARLNNARMIALAKSRDRRAGCSQSGGQLDPMIRKYGEERVLNIVGSLAGRSLGGGPGDGPDRGPGGGR